MLLGGVNDTKVLLDTRDTMVLPNISKTLKILLTVEDIKMPNGTKKTTKVLPDDIKEIKVLPDAINKGTEMLPADRHTNVLSDDVKDTKV